MAELEKSLETKKIEIKYVFTDKEKTELADQLTLRISERDDLEQEKKDVTSTYNAQIKRADSDISTIAAEHRQGYKMKVHPCYEIFNYTEKTVFICRADTNEIVDQRTMTSDELQKDIWYPREEILELPAVTEPNNEIEDSGEVVEVDFNEVKDDDSGDSLLEDESLEADRT